MTKNEYDQHPKILIKKNLIVKKILSIRQWDTVCPQCHYDPGNDIPEYCPVCGFKMLRDFIEWEGSSIGENW